MYHVTSVEIESIVHKAPKRFFVQGVSRGLDGQLIDPLNKMLNYVVNAESFDELKTPPNYGLHTLTGDRAGSWAMTVSRNWRMTFIKVDEYRIADLDLEDYP